MKVSRISGSWLLLCSGWSERSGREAFLNTREDGPHSPGFDRAAQCESLQAEFIRDIPG